MGRSSGGGRLVLGDDRVLVSNCKADSGRRIGMGNTSVGGDETGGATSFSNGANWS